MSGINSAYSSSSRVTGMYSGLDIDALVESMCSNQQAKIDRQEQKKTAYEWHNEAVTEVMDAVKEFSNTYCSVLGTSSMLKSSTYSTFTVNSDSTSRAAAISVTNAAEAGDIMVKINQLAVNANVSSTGRVSATGTGISSSNTATLANLSFADKLRFDSSGKISFAINGKSFSFTKDTTLQSMINTINHDADANVTMKYSRLSDSFSITADSGGKDSAVSIVNFTGNAFGSDSAFQIGAGTTKNGQNSVAEINGTVVEKDSNQYTIDGISYTLNAVTARSGSSPIVRQLAKNSSASSIGGISANGLEISADNTATLAELSFQNVLTFDGSDNISFAINGKTFTFAKTTVLQDMLDTVNNDPDANVTMQYSRLRDGFTITADSGGKNSKITIENKSGNAFGANSAFQIGTGVVENGQNSIAVIDGVTVERDSNSYTIDGNAYELTEVTDLSDEYISFTVSRDYSSTVQAVTSFVEAFNELITKLGSLVDAKDYSRDYPPLTEAQKADMTESQIEKWNEKAKGGILRHDSDLENLISNLRNAFFSAAGGTGKSSAAIGISAGNYYGPDKGLLVLDTEALSAALKTNPEEVISVFIAGSSSSASPDQGLVYKLKSSLSSYQKTVTDSVSNTEDKIDGIGLEIVELEDRLDTLAAKYYQKFSAMETALASLNSQASYISQLFA